ncbi:sporulation protein [Candidatus Woesearchaeota archaeon]|nr:sporulation protein [Candidatus Woesearchaeota archaeon]
MVLGIGEGSVEIILDKYSFAIGDTINGKVNLKLNQAKKANSLRVEFYGEILKRSGKSNHIQRVHHVKAEISGERHYQPGESLSFSLKVPSDINYPKPQGFIATLLAKPRPQGWYVHASLNSPMQFDINKRVKVMISDAQGKPI